MKILYAAGNREGSYLQYARFLQSMRNKNIDLKTAGYQKSIKDLNVDYTLDALINFTKDDSTITINGNYRYYQKQIETFAPDLIISDLEIYTSTIATELKIKLWQVSPLLLYFAIPDKIKLDLNIFANNRYTFEFISFGGKSNINNILNKSNKKLVVSHLCDTQHHTNIKDNYEWLRPEFDFYEGIKTIKVSNGCEMETADFFYNELPYSFDVNKSDAEAIFLSELENYYNKKEKMKIEINNNVKFLKEMIV